MRARVACLAALASVASPVSAGPADEAAAGLTSQMKAWNAGKLEDSLSYYWNSDQITWVNRRGLTRGFASFAAEMRAMKPAERGVYTVEILDRRDLSKDQALIVIRWDISLNGKRQMGSVSTQIWRRFTGGMWRIVFEHAS